MPRRRAALLALFFAASPVLAQADSPALLDQLGSLVKDGHLRVETDWKAGRVPAIPAYVLEVQGRPRTTIAAEAKNGQVTTLHCRVENGKLIVRGRGLRPRVSIEALDFESPQGITNLRFHGVGIWKPIVAIFGGIARSAVRKLEFRTDILSVLKGEILGGKKPVTTPLPAGPPLEPTPEPAAEPSTGGPSARPPSLADLVTEVRVTEMALTAFEGRRLSFEPFLEFRTAAHPQSGEALRLTIERGVFRPGRDGGPNFLDVAGRLDGEIEDGTMEFGKDRSTIARGRIQGGTFRVLSGEDGKAAKAFTASLLAFELSSGKFEVPGGLRVELDQGSKFDVREVRVTPAGTFSGVADLDLAGRTGEFARGGTKLATSNVHLRSTGLRVENGRATGPVELTFDYELEYPFVVKYPIKEIPEKKLTLDFHGPLAATLELSDAGGEEGEVTGDYVFKAPWPPIEKAALFVLEAKWRQDLAVKNVDFTLVPKIFRPCGLSCFTLGFEFTAAKKSGRKSLFSQFCAPVGMAELYVDKEARSFVLRDVRVQTHCEGAVGWVVNLVAPLLAKTYSDAVLFRMPPGLPLTIESVRGGVEWIEIRGRIDWQAGASSSVPGQ